MAGDCLRRSLAQLQCFQTLHTKGNNGCAKTDNRRRAAIRIAVRLIAQCRGETLLPIKIAIQFLCDPIVRIIFLAFYFFTNLYERLP